MGVFLASSGIVALSEMGDKTQLLAFALASRYRKPWAILGAIVLSSLATHGAAAYLGNWVAGHVRPVVMAFLLGVSFLLFAAWTLQASSLDELRPADSRNAFLTTTLVFFLSEMGDKTQLATAALAIKYDAPLVVTVGSTVGMAATDALAIFLGERVARHFPIRVARWLAAGLFFTFGVASLTRAM